MMPIINCEFVIIEANCENSTANSTNPPSDSSPIFMSISPSRNLGSTSSSSSHIPIQNPNSNHGPIFSQPHPQQNQPPDSPSSHRTQSPQSVQISNSRPPNAKFDKASGELPPVLCCYFDSIFFAFRSCSDRTLEYFYSIQSFVIYIFLTLYCCF